MVKLHFKHNLLLKNLKYFVFFILIIVQSNQLFSQNKVYVRSKPKLGEGITKILERFLLPSNTENINLFKDLNEGKILKHGNLMLNYKYKIPIEIRNVKPKHFKNSIQIEDDEIINSIKKYNEKIVKQNLIKEGYKQTGKIWIPIYLLNSEKNVRESKSSKISAKNKANKVYKKNKSQNEKIKNSNDRINESETLSEEKIIKQDNTANEIKGIESNNEESNDSESAKKIKPEPKSEYQENIEPSPGYVDYPLLGKSYEKVKLIDNRLEGHVIYLDPGHGGPDPGAIGYCDGHALCEDEYAYDVILRLARALLQHGATVYVVVQDPKDGIRDQQYLKCDEDEKYLGGIPIDRNLKERLHQRAEIINNLYKKNAKTAKSQHNITIHLDSRPTKQRIDIFYYFKSGSPQSEKFAHTLYNTIKEKYDKNQPGRGYNGSVTTRSLYMLRNLLPTSVYIELGNLQNKMNQIRFLDFNNRQAIANWLCDGVMRYLLK